VIGLFILAKILLVKNKLKFELDNQKVIEIQIKDEIH